MSRATYTAITCKSAINRVSGMPFKWSLNPYRGCVHACQYCYARETHAFLGLNAGRDFETTIFYKENVAAVLRHELRARNWNREQIAIGTATDAYQPAEGALRITRGCLKEITEANNPVSIVTKSTLVRRDIDLLSELTLHARVRVYFSVTTLDPSHWHLMEPGTPPPDKRLEAMAALVKSGVGCGVLMAPVMPGINDAAESIDAVAKAATFHGASSFTALPLRLSPLVRNHFLNFITEHMPELSARYQRDFSGSHPPAIWRDRISAQSTEAAFRHGLATSGRPQVVPSSPRNIPSPEQLHLL